MTRLVDCLTGSGLSPGEAREALAWGKVWYRGAPTALATREVDPGAVEYRPEAPRHRVGRDPCVLLAGDGFVVVLKPPGMLSVPAQGRRDPDVLRWAARRYGSSWVVHRLDEGTSGLLLVALSETALLALKEDLHRHDVERRYLALVRGRFPDRLTSSGPIGDDPAVTHFVRLESLRQSSLVEARLETGRRHQVRIHLAREGHPVLGDTVYGPTGEGLAGKGRTRFALHAWRLGFRRPDTGEFAAVEAPLADDLESLRRRMGGRP